jgi:hypothetical protein
MMVRLALRQPLTSGVTEMAAMFNIPGVTKSNDKIEWETLDLKSLPPVLAKQVTAIHEAQTALAKMKESFGGQFNELYSEAVPDGMVRRFSFKFDGLSFGNVDAKVMKSGKAKVTFTAKKVAK